MNVLRWFIKGPSIHFYGPKNYMKLIDVKYFLQFSKVVILFGLLATLEEFCS